MNSLCIEFGKTSIRCVDQGEQISAVSIKLRLRDQQPTPLQLVGNKILRYIPMTVVSVRRL